MASLSSAGLQHGWHDCPALDPNSNRIALATRGNKVALWDAKNDALKTVGQHSDVVTALALSTGGGLLAAGSRSLIRVWDTSDGKLRNEFPSDETVVALAFTPDNRQLVSGGMDHGERLWDLSKGELTWSGPATIIISASFTRDGRLVTAGRNWGDRGDLRIWDCEQMRPRLVSEFHCSNHITTAALSPDGKIAAAGNSGGVVVVYDLETLQHKTDVIGHGGAVSTLAFSPDGKTLISGGYDGKLVFWNVESWQQVGTIRHQRQMHAVRFLQPTQEQQGFLVFQGEPEFDVSLDWVNMSTNRHDEPQPKSPRLR